YPLFVRDFVGIFFYESRDQMQEMEGRLPESLIACVGGGSKAMCLFDPFLDDSCVEIMGVEAGGQGVDTEKHAACLNGGVLVG
ncbi:tryptophan synthase subunit beta, partial [Pseudomonas syringae pv. tagetis]